MRSTTLGKSLSIISAIFIQLAYGSFYTFGAFIPYLASFIYYKYDQGITVTKLSFILAVQFILLNSGMILSSIIGKKLTFKIQVIISCIGLSLSVFISSFFEQTWGFVLFYGSIFGFSIGFGYLAPFKNTYQYFPNNKGLMGGICAMAFGFGALVFNTIFQQVINPDNQHFNQKGVFPLQVAQKVPYALKFMSVVYAVIGFIGVATFYQIKKQKNIIENQASINTMLTSSEDTDGTSEIIVEDQTTQKVTMQFLMKKKIHLLFLLVTCSLPFGLFNAFSYKQFGRQHINDDFYLTLVGSIGSIANGSCRIIWGFLMDKIPFKYIIAIINTSLLCSIILINFDFIIQDKILYAILVVFTYFNYGGAFAIFPTQTVRMIGSKLGTKLYPYIFLAFTLASTIQFFLHYFFVVELGYQGFKYCFIIFGVIQLIGLILSFVIKFQYDPKQKAMIKSKRAQIN